MIHQLLLMKNTLTALSCHPTKPAHVPRKYDVQNLDQHKHDCAKLILLEM